jgi:hypothetical protein
MYIWSDKYTYREGQPVTLRWTVKTHGDLYPYTVFVYRQNNQTGAKTFFPGGGSEPVDINGKTEAEGFQPVQMADVTKGVLIGADGRFPAFTVPSGQFGMHTFVVQLRDYTGTHPLKTSYMKIGVVRGASDVSGDITSSRTLTNDTEWNLRGTVVVKDGATLTIEPGTFVLAGPGPPPSLLLIASTGRIQAKGTRSRPIILSSNQPFGKRNRGDWAGLILLGKAPVNTGANADGRGAGAGQFYPEGLTARPEFLYGGSDTTHDCGTLEYVRSEYAGFVLTPNNEINSISWYGCGTKTVANHLESSFGLDDLFEWFGGTMDAKYLLGIHGRDDYLDFQLGTTGRLQYHIGLQSPDLPGNRGVEGDNSEYDAAATPRSNPTFYNVTFIGQGTRGFDEANAPGLFLRRGANGTFGNFLIMNFFSSCMELGGAGDNLAAATQAQLNAGNIKIDGLLCYDANKQNSGANTLDGQIVDATNRAYARGTTASGAAKNLLFGSNPLLGRPFEYSDPDFKALFSSPVFRTGWVQPPDDGFFDQNAHFVGGMGDDDWTEEWTSFLMEADIAQ